MVAALLGLYVLLPRIAGLDDTWGRIRDGEPAWLLVAGLLEVFSYAAYVVLLRTVAGGADGPLPWRLAWQLTFAGVAASRLLATAGAGGIALTAWALTRLGVAAQTVAARMATLFVLLYGVFFSALVLCGLGLSAGLLAGPSPFGLTVVPALFGAAVVSVALTLALVGHNHGSAESRPPASSRRARLRAIAAAAPVTIGTGMRDALVLIRARDPALLGALFWWGCDVLVLWAAMHAFGTPPAAGVLVMSYFVGQLANVLPIPGGIGGVEGGMIAALVAFGEPAGLALTAVLTYRALAFWLPIAPGAVAYVQLTRALGRR